MSELHLELSELEVESLEFGRHNQDESDLASIMSGQGMTEIGASPATCQTSPCCCSCCPTCCRPFSLEPVPTVL